MKQFDIICCSTDNWDDVWRRRQHVCQELSKRDWVDKILFVEPAILVWNIFRSKSFSIFTDAGRLRKINDKIYVYRPLWLIPFVRFKIVRDINLYIYLMQVRLKIRLLKLINMISWFSHPMYVVIAGKFGEEIVWYDCTDDWSEMPAITEQMSGILKKQQKIMLKNADIVTAVSKSLYDNARLLNSNSHLVPNGVDVANCEIHKSAKKSIPNDMHAINKPILGYIGTIWEDRMDFELIEYIAKKRKEWSLVFVGPITVNLKSNFKSIDNVYFLGQKSYNDLAVYINNFDVCVIPHKKNKMTENMNPIKLFEYFASGKPIVSTDIAGARDYSDVIMIANSKEEFVSMCENVFMEKDVFKKKRLQYAIDNSWNKRVNQIESIINEAINNNN